MEFKWEDIFLFLKCTVFSIKWSPFAQCQVKFIFNLWSLRHNSCYFFKSRGLLFFLRILFIFRERRRKGEREGEKHQCVRETSIACLLLTPSWGCGQQPRCVPWQELNRWPFGSQVGAQSTEPHQTGWRFTDYCFSVEVSVSYKIRNKNFYTILYSEDIR